MIHSTVGAKKVITSFPCDRMFRFVSSSFLETIIMVCASSFCLNHFLVLVLFYSFRTCLLAHTEMVIQKNNRDCGTR